MNNDLETTFNFWYDSKDFLKRQLTILNYKISELEEQIIGYKGSMVNNYSSGNSSTSPTSKLSFLLDKKDIILDEINNINNKLSSYDNFFSCLDILEVNIIELYHHKKNKIFETASLLGISRVTLNKKRFLVYKKWQSIINI